ncbi:3-dehydroquinate synthase [Filimonas sp.]|nr:3-dehydroquinate synthase [Filimonas sp.]
MISRLFYEGHERELLSYINEKNYSQIILLADANTNGYCIPVLKKLIPAFKTSSLIIIPKGEQNKTLEVCTLIWHELDKLKADRYTLLINIGGGMVSDIGGFASSVYKRGIDFINVPTTLLAMVDACYGGKTGIDFNGFKNSLGSFQHPSAIYIHPVFLQTLDERVLQSGLAESIKHAMLSSEDQLKN